MAPLVRIRLRPDTLPTAIGSLVREARTGIGWSQSELAARARTSQTKVWRIESGDPTAFDLGTLDRVVGALGLRQTLEVEGRHLADRDEQRDPVHAALASAMAGRLRRCGWSVESEVPTGASAPTGWVDLAAFRARDAALVIIEIKADLPDIGGLQRQVGWYEKGALHLARDLGWRPMRTCVAVVCLDTAAIARRLREHRGLLVSAFPGDARTLSAWLRDPSVTFDGRRTLAVTDLRPRRGPSLAPSALHGRRATPTYESYADAMAILRARRGSLHGPRNG